MNEMSFEGGTILEGRLKELTRDANRRVKVVEMKERMEYRALKPYEIDWNSIEGILITKPKEGMIYINANILSGSVIGDNCFLIYCKIGNNIRVGSRVVASDDLIVGNNVEFEPYAKFGTYSKFGKEVEFKEGASFSAWANFGEMAIFGDCCRFFGLPQFGAGAKFGRNCEVITYSSIIGIEEYLRNNK